MNKVLFLCIYICSLMHMSGMLVAMGDSEIQKPVALYSSALPFIQAEQNSQLPTDQKSSVSNDGAASAQSLVSVSPRYLDVVCPICQDNLKEVQSKLKCGHVFCKDCLDRYAQTQSATKENWDKWTLGLSKVFTEEHPCPVCRGVLIRPENIMIRTNYQCKYCNLSFTNNPKEMMVSLVCPATWLRWNDIKHYYHSYCLSDFIRVSKKGTNSKGKTVFYCTEHETEHDVTAAEAVLANLAKPQTQQQ